MMLRRGVFLLILVAMLTVQAQAGDVITDVVSRKSKGPDLKVVTLEDGLVAYVDRSYRWTSPVPEELVGADYVMTSNDDSDAIGVEIDVTLGVPAKVYLFIDNRLTDGIATDPPTIGPKMQWVLDMGFEDTGLTMSMGEVFTLYARNFAAGTITLFEMDDSKGSFYLIAAVPGVAPVCAKSPSPEDAATDVIRDVVMSWTPGESAATHDVYFGDSFEDVNNATPASPLQVSSGKAATTHDPGRLEFGKTYYWRVDEVNGAPDHTVFKGSVWSFTVEPYVYELTPVVASASSSKAGLGPEKTIDGSGLTGSQHGTDDTTMWSTSAGLPAWIQYQFDHVYKLHEMWVWNSNQSTEVFDIVSIGAKDVIVEYATGAGGWQVLPGVSQLVRAPGAADCEPQKIDFGGIAASKVRLTINSNWGSLIPQTGLSEVRFYYVPVSAREPQPTPGKVNVNPEGLTLTWRAGREAGSHDLYLGTDPNAVAGGTAAKVNTTEASYAPAVEIDAKYYWKVNEINVAESLSIWEGSVWSFSTPQFLVVDDFEGYTNNSPKRVFQAWIDGMGFSPDGFFPNGQSGNGSGSIVGKDPAAGDIMEKAVVRASGKQSMPLFYDNTGAAKISETSRTFGVAQDWAGMGGKTLVLFFYGDTANTGQLYVKINGKKVAYDGAATAISRPWWTQWNVDLAASGANVHSVTSISIGVEGGGSGKLLIDDLRVYKSAPPVTTFAEELWIEAESGSVTVPMAVTNDPLASGGRCIGTDPSQTDSQGNPPTEGVAKIPFTVAGGTYKLMFRILIPGDNDSIWVRIAGATSHTTAPHASGWIKFNNMPRGETWHWSYVHNADVSNTVVEWTLPKGTHTLEIAYREAGSQVDVVVVQSVN